MRDIVEKVSPGLGRGEGMENDGQGILRNQYKFDWKTLNHSDEFGV
jgi:hypothetical protein